MENKPNGLRWCGTLYPTQASAQDAEMSLRDYEEFVFRAGLLHLADPVAAWEAIHVRQQRVCDYLQKKKVVRFRVPPSGDHDGTDLTVDVNPRRRAGSTAPATRTSPMVRSSPAPRMSRDT